MLVISTRKHDRGRYERCAVHLHVKRERDDGILFESCIADPANQLRVDEHGAVGQVALRVLQPCRAAGQLPGEGARRDGAQTRLEVRLHSGRRGRLRRKGRLYSFHLFISPPNLVKYCELPRLSRVNLAKVLGCCRCRLAKLVLHASSRSIC